MPFGSLCCIYTQDWPRISGLVFEFLLLSDAISNINANMNLNKQPRIYSGLCQAKAMQVKNPYVNPFIKLWPFSNYAMDESLISVVLIAN